VSLSTTNPICDVPRCPRESRSDAGRPQCSEQSGRIARNKALCTFPIRLRGSGVGARTVQYTHATLRAAPRGRCARRADCTQRRTARPRRATAGQATSAADHRPGELAAQLLRGPGSDAESETPTADLLSTLTRSLSVPEIRQLAHAIDTKSRVWIDYAAATGGATRRVIGQPELIGSSLYAWCEQRADERIFSVSRIQSVAAV
jgi:hypothetical protein